jgi:hypothetical protein
MQFVMSRDYFESQVREFFRHFAPDPPPELWTAIEQRVTKASSSALWLKIAATMLLIFTSGVTFWFVPDSVYNFPALAAVEQQQPITPIPSLAHNVTLVNQGNLHTQRPEYELPAQNQGIASLKTISYSEIPVREKPKKLHLPPALLNEKNSRYPDVYIGAQVMTQYSYRQINAPGVGSAGIPFQRLEEPIFSFSYGLSVTMRFSEKFALQSGLNYLNLGQYLNNIMAFSSNEKLPLFGYDSRHSFFHPQTIITSQGYIRLSNPSFYFADGSSYRILTNKDYVNGQEAKLLSHIDDGLTQQTSYLEIPMVFRYRILQQNMGLHIKGGFSGAYLVSNQVYLGRNLMQPSIGETHGLRKLNFSAIGGVILSIPVSGKLTLNIEPTGQIFLKPMVKDEFFPGRVYPYNFSIFSGITYGF